MRKPLGESAHTREAYLALEALGAARKAQGAAVQALPVSGLDILDDAAAPTPRSDSHRLAVGHVVAALEALYARGEVHGAAAACRHKMDTARVSARRQR